MSTPTPQQYANLADDVYNNRQVTPPNKTIVIGEHHYKVLAVHANSKTGYHGAVYQDADTNAVIVAHRGTEFKSGKDWRTNFGMLKDLSNNQAGDATVLTQKAINKVNDLHQKNPDQPKLNITQTGHSLGGALAQLEAYRTGQHGATFNAYGAANLSGIPKGGNKVTNYAMASDAASAAGPHYGREVILAKQSELNILAEYGYNNLRNTPATRAFGAAKATVGTMHTIDNFIGSDSVFSERNYDRARELAEQNKNMIRDYRGDVATQKNNLHHGAKAVEIIYRSFPLKNSFENVIEQERNHIKERQRVMPLSQAPDISQPLEKNATDRDFINYGFAALLADNGKERDTALNSLFASDIGKNLQQQAEKAAFTLDRDQEQQRLAVERDQEQQRLAEAPAMRMRV